jgi:hypothetical protein
MKWKWIVLGTLVASGAVGADSQTNSPARTPEELGKRMASVLIAGDTNAAAILLPSYEAYMPICMMNLGETPATEANMRLVYSQWMGRLRKQIAQFPAEFAKATPFKADQIDKVDVTPQQEAGRSNWCDVDLTFRVKDQKFLLKLDECLQFSNGWYFVDMDWCGKQD